MLHTAAEREHLIAEIAAEAALVPPFTEGDDLDGSDIVLVTTQPPAAASERLLDWLRLHPEVVLLDCAQPGIAGDEARCVTDRLPSPRPAPGTTSPTPRSQRLCASSRRSRRSSPTRSTSRRCARSRRSGPTRSTSWPRRAQPRLSGHPMDRPDLLPAVLAFDLAPAGGDRSAVLEAQLGRLLPGVECRVHVVDAGVFHGYLATVLVRCGVTPSSQRLRSLVRASDGFRLAEKNKVFTTTEVVEHGAVVVCGDLQAKQGWVSVWLLADGLAVGNDAAIELLSLLSA